MARTVRRSSGSWENADRSDGADFEFLLKPNRYGQFMAVLMKACPEKNGRLLRTTVCIQTFRKKPRNDRRLRACSTWKTSANRNATIVVLVSECRRDTRCRERSSDFTRIGMRGVCRENRVETCRGRAKGIVRRRQPVKRPRFARTSSYSWRIAIFLPTVLKQKVQTRKKTKTNKTSVTTVVFFVVRGRYPSDRQPTLFT